MTIHSLLKLIDPLGGRSLRDIRHWKARHISQLVFCVLMTLIVLLYALFWLVGYDRPYDDNPDLNAPLFTGTLIVAMIVLMVLAVAATVVSGVRSFAHMHGAGARENGIASMRIALGTAAAVIVVMAATFALAPTGGMSVNGAVYADALWLRMAEMFVDTSLLLLAVAVVAVAYGYMRRASRRKEDRPCS